MPEAAAANLHQRRDIEALQTPRHLCRRAGGGRSRGGPGRAGDQVPLQQGQARAGHAAPTAPLVLHAAGVLPLACWLCQPPSLSMPGEAAQAMCIHSSRFT